MTPIAIVGIGLRFPGANDPQSFWELIAAGRSVATTPPPGRWVVEAERVVNPQGGPDRIYNPRGCFIDDAPVDCDGLALDARDIAPLDPINHLVLAAGRDAWLSCQHEAVDRRRTGLVIGNIALPTAAAGDLAASILQPRIAQALGLALPAPADVDARNRYLAGLPAGLLAAGLGLGGGCKTIDAACASGLYSVALAMEELRSGRADCMIAGGASRPDSLYTQMGFTALSALSRNGVCRPFDAAGDGLVVGEGAGIVVLKRLDDARAHGDTIHAVLAGYGLSNDQAGALFSPDSNGQQRAMRAAYAMAGWQPWDVQLIECHGTGTPVGDGVEVGSLQACWESAPAATRAVIGSVKSNIGHLLTGAGAAGLIKTLLAMRERQLPPTANFATANPKLGLETSPFSVLQTATSWDDDQQRAAVSAFGFGGINAHLLLTSDQPPAKRRRNAAPRASTDEAAIAIIGLGAHIGPWQDIDQLRPRLLGRDDGHRPAPPRHWWDEQAAARHAGFWVDTVELPAGRFAMPPKEIDALSDQQALMLRAAMQAVDDAGLGERGLDRTAWGCTIGIGLDLRTTDFSLRWRLAPQLRERGWSEPLISDALDRIAPALDADRVMGNLGGIVASRVARVLKIGGPSYTVSAEDSSGSQALLTAIRALQCGQIDVALSGAVEVQSDPRHLLPTATHRPIDADHPACEGAVALVLKRLADAERDGDAIYAVIEEAAESCSDATTAMPHESRVGFGGPLQGPLGLLASALALSEGIEPPDDQHRAARAWLHNRSDGPRRATTSCSGVGHAAVHFTLREAGDQRRAHEHPLGALAAQLIVLDAAFIAAETKALRNLAMMTPFSQLAARWQAEHPIPERPVCLILRDPDRLDDLLARAEQAVHQRRACQEPDLVYAPKPLGEQGQALCWVFPGSGNHRFGTMRGLSAHWPRLVDRLQAENERLLDQFAHGKLWRDDLSDDDLSHPDVLLGQVWAGSFGGEALARCGLKPAAILGCSLGETAGLITTRTWRQRDELLARLESSPLFIDQLCGACTAAQEHWGTDQAAWKLGLVARSAAELQPLIDQHERVYLLIITGPQACVIGGDPAAVDAVVAALGEHFWQLRGVTSVHCPVAEPVAGPYRDLHVFPTTPPPGLTVYSGILGRSYAVSPEACADSIVGQALATLDWCAVVEQAWADGQRVFVECGPGNSASRGIASILADKPHAVVALDPPGDDDGRGLLLCLAVCIAHGIPVDLRALHRQEPPLHPPLPSSRSQTLTVGLKPVDTMPQPPRSMNREQCLEIAVGKLGNVLGPLFAEADTYPTRVRLPAEPLMLVDRIIDIEGEPRSMGSGRIITEHDVLPGDWYLDAGVMPTSITVESGQADLFLGGWLGIDFITKGKATYRLLDATITFHDSLPPAGVTVRYDIRIDGFFRQGETYLFRFNFEGTVDGKRLLTMTNGIAGFFTQAELDAGQGVVIPTALRGPVPGEYTPDYRPLVSLEQNEAYSDAQLDALRRGDLAACYGSAFAAANPQGIAGLPDGRMRLVHRILCLDPSGGRHGLGMIVGEADIHPDDWFLTCHFCDDMVMPGTLMYECCLHTLRVYLLRLGWVPLDGPIVYEPIPGCASQLKCRGQVLTSTKRVQYEITLKKLGYDEQGQPIVIADALMYGDGRPIVHMIDMSLRLRGISKTSLESFWMNHGDTETRSKTSMTHPPCPRPSAVNYRRSPPVVNAEGIAFDDASITAYAAGKPSAAFGSRYSIFDGDERIIARLPRAPYKFLNRIVSITGCEQWVMKAGGTIIAEYDVPPDDWYFSADGQAGRSGAPLMPFCVLLEAALQPCGWLSGYVGSALSAPHDLSYRNLGGTATQHRHVTPDIGTLCTEVTMTGCSTSGGMVIQQFTFAMSDGQGQAVYSGSTMFGFFSKEALANQVGIREATLYQPSAAELGRALAAPYPQGHPYPAPELQMITRIDRFVPDGGPQGLGYMEGSLDIDPSAWYFQAHFYQDPVTPGSLGLESFLQLLRVWACEHWQGVVPGRLQANGIGLEHSWLYRGQVLPTDQRCTVQVVISSVDEQTRTVWADGYLGVDGRTIYQMIGFSLQFG